MNPNNYGTLPACQRLAEAGIVLETEKVWHLNGDKETYSLQTRGSSPSLLVRWGDFPAPSMAEVWRELPEDIKIPAIGTRFDGEEYLTICKESGRTIAGYGYYPNVKISTNPTDALIDLLIWARKEKV